MSSPSYDIELDHSATWPGPAGPLSILSYNIKGLPWPIAFGRKEANSAIGQRLAAMRSSNAQPRIVLLQEAFGDIANKLGKDGGYRFVVNGPQFASSHEAQPLGRSFAKGAQWIKGEGAGSLIDSGLAILSDYPIIKVERYAFPEGACAGYDCLAAKGVIVAWIDVPGAGEPIAIVNAHLNSRGAAHVTSERADRAYSWQVAAVREFLSKALPNDTPVIFGGDFNTGDVSIRVASVAQPLLHGAQVDGLRTVLAKGNVVSGSQDEARRIVVRNKDKILFRGGRRVGLLPERAWVPFPLATQEPLSDHAGFVIDFSLE
ncbi:endonuclease/exonuclease/phosphatase family protein [Novosphingobium mathurense]|uniref:Metal-dependent hydrolase, endonuclease/exonuclease/phosphatase family n=1 Tax=Novosphingobium mathurense TaxID=428990 RepID=A0A1U6H3C4_9SPHN|nr:endonuclease/exonuclease/phosphatase family protein [Novosphingobium mathurense]SLJ90247.1 Metal-dependent hydrolase, endonuclease/exonuclease/phosphatase family [Novosphingobium mathurense]